MPDRLRLTLGRGALLAGLLALPSAVAGHAGDPPGLAGHTGMIHACVGPPARGDAAGGVTRIVDPATGECRPGDTPHHWSVGPPPGSPRYRVLDSLDQEVGVLGSDGSVLVRQSPSLALRLLGLGPAGVGIVATFIAFIHFTTDCSGSRQLEASDAAAFVETAIQLADDQGRQRAWYAATPPGFASLAASAWARETVPFGTDPDAPGTCAVQDTGFAGFLGAAASVVLPAWVPPFRLE